MHQTKAVLLLSGGLDSSTLLALAMKEGYAVNALSFRYGQRHDAELAASQTIAKQYEVVQHMIMNIDLRAFGGSALTSSVPVPLDRPVDDNTTIPITYVPARNTIFLSFALAWAEVLGANDIFIGVNSLDYSGYPDCRPEFIDAFEKMAHLATRAGVEGGGELKIRTPLIDMTKSEIIRLGLDLGVDYGLTMSCYNPEPGSLACGRCDACQLRLRGFMEAGATDPARYASGPARATGVSV